MCLHDQQFDSDSDVPPASLYAAGTGCKKELPEYRQLLLFRLNILHIQSIFGMFRGTSLRYLYVGIPAIKAP